MRALFLFLVLFSTLSATEKPTTVRVLITKAAKQSQIEVKGRHVLYDPVLETFLAASHKNRKAKITAHERGLKWDEVIPRKQIRIVPDEKNCSILIDGIQYRGWVEVYAIGGTINIVNEVDAENFLKATLSKQPLAKLSKEALDALVITERTNLYHRIARDAYATFQLQAEKVGYSGITQSKPVYDAVERTRDMVLHYKNKPFAATWGEHHAGRSISHQTIYRKEETVPPGVDNLPSLSSKTKTAWKVSLPLHTLAEHIGLQQLAKIDLFHAKQSGKVYGLRLSGSEGTKDLSIQSFQKALGASALPSNDFTVAVRGKKAHFSGYGKGMGTGLCLASAEVLSYRNASTEKILLTHFPGTKLVNVRTEAGKRPASGFAWQ